MKQKYQPFYVCTYSDCHVVHQAGVSVFIDEEENIIKQIPSPISISSAKFSYPYRFTAHQYHGHYIMQYFNSIFTFDKEKTTLLYTIDNFSNEFVNKLAVCRNTIYLINDGELCEL